MLLVASARGSPDGTHQARLGRGVLWLEPSWVALRASKTHDELSACLAALHHSVPRQRSGAGAHLN